MYEGITVGMDMGDKKDRVCVLDGDAGYGGRCCLVRLVTEMA